MISPLSKSARLVALFAIVLSLMVILASLMSCNPLKPYKDVLKDSVFRDSTKLAMLAIPCSQAYPIKAITGKTIVDTQYVANPFAGSDCGALIDSLNGVIKLYKITGDSLNVDSLKKELLSRLKSPVINHYRVDTVPDKAAIAVINQDRDKAIIMAANSDKLTCDANTKVKQFEQDKQSTWQCFKWFCSSLPYWIWIILTMIFGGTIVIKLLKSGILKFV